jgi:ABC-type sugar transport system ATPase subunit
MTLSDRIAVVNMGPIEQFGTPLELYHKPRNTFVAGFIGSPAINLLKGRIRGIGEGSVELEMPGGNRASGLANLSSDALNQSVIVGIRAGVMWNQTAKISASGEDARWQYGYYPAYARWHWPDRRFHRFD